MRETRPGAVLLGVVVGSTLVQTAAILFWWQVLGPWHAYDYYFEGFEDPPLWLVGSVYLVETSLVAALLGLIYVPVMRRWAALRRWPGNAVVILIANAAAGVPFAITGDIPDRATFLVAALAATAVAIPVAAGATHVARRRADADEAALRAAFAADPA